MNEWGNVSLLSGLNWCGLVLIGWIIQFFYIKKQYIKRGHKTFFGKVISYLWAISGCTIFLIVYLALTRHESPEPYILATIAIPTVITGVMIRFRPLIIGGILFILFAIIAVNVQTDYIRSAITAIALLFGYLIPGYMLRMKK